MIQGTSWREHVQRLDAFYSQVSGIILARQHPVTGLLPASTAITAHGDYTDAWVRDNVYSILAAWGLALAYRRVDETGGRTVLLEQSVVKLMRGLLMAMMRQADKVEAFKVSQNPADALHAKYDTGTGLPVVGDHEWGHLQLDATSLFLLCLAQMTASGLRIVFTLDEVNFVQNLVHYIGRAYRTPDYGIWERGHKINRGEVELNSSSVGMAKAALEALDGFNLFGAGGGAESVIHVIPDEIARARITLQSQLPRESLSKEVDAATLSVIGFPAFAIRDANLVAATEGEIIAKLAGRYGCKRFLRDGHQTVLEDEARLHYEPDELKRFEHIECEWPLFFAYLLLNALFRGDREAAGRYRAQLQGLTVEVDGWPMLPELYFVPADRVEAEKADPGSQDREPNENVPLVWAQSLYLLGGMLDDGLLDVADLDPLGRRLNVGRARRRRIQIALLAENEAVSARLAEQGIAAQTPAEVAPIQLHPADQLAQAFCALGANERLGLSGRPLRHLRGLATAYVYETDGARRVFLPQFMDRRDFYLPRDSRMLVQRLRMELAYLHTHWFAPGRPLLAFLVTEAMLDEAGSRALLELMEELRDGETNGIPVQLGRIAEFIASTGRRRIPGFSAQRFKTIEDSRRERERPAFLILPLDPQALQPLGAKETGERAQWIDQQLLDKLSSDPNLYAQFAAVEVLVRRHGLSAASGLRSPVGEAASLRDLLEEIYVRAGDFFCWDLLRRSADLLGRHDIDLEGAATELFVRHLGLNVGPSYTRASTLRTPVSADVLLARIREANQGDPGSRALIAELIVHLGLLIREEPQLFADMQTVRLGHLLGLMLTRQGRSVEGDAQAAFSTLFGLSPHGLHGALRDTLAAISGLGRFQLRWAAGSEAAPLEFSESSDPAGFGGASDWQDWRQHLGVGGCDGRAFHAAVHDLLGHCDSLVIGDTSKQSRRLEPILRSEMTREEQAFALRVDHLLNAIQQPLYRQLSVEALAALAALRQKRPLWQFAGSLRIDDVLVAAARESAQVRQAELDGSSVGERDRIWQDFGQCPPHHVANCVLAAVAKMPAAVV